VVTGPIEVVDFVLLFGHAAFSLTRTRVLALVCSLLVGEIHARTTIMLRSPRWRSIGLVCVLLRRRDIRVHYGTVCFPQMGERRIIY
jgi:hypothetical protein